MYRGVNWFDTADSYGTGSLEGQSEKLLGKFIREHNYKAAGGVKSPNDVLIATKVCTNENVISTLRKEES